MFNLASGCPVFNLEQRCLLFKRVLSEFKFRNELSEDNRSPLIARRELLAALGLVDERSARDSIALLYSVLLAILGSQPIDESVGDGVSAADVVMSDYTKEDFMAMATSIFCMAYVFAHMLFMGDWAVDDILNEGEDPSTRRVSLLRAVVEALISSPFFVRRVSELMPLTSHTNKKKERKPGCHYGTLGHNIRETVSKLKNHVGPDSKKDVRRLRVTSLLEETVDAFIDLTEHCEEYPHSVNPLMSWFDPVGVWASLVLESKAETPQRIWDCTCSCGTKECSCPGIFTLTSKQEID